MHLSIRRLLPLLALLLALIGCGAAPESGPTATPAPSEPTPAPDASGEAGYPAPAATGDASPGYPVEGAALPVQVAPAESDFTVAAQAATEWNPDARFLGIVPPTQMFKNLSMPAIIGGWFFKFKDPATPDEFYVLVINGKVSGSTVAQPILMEPLPYAEEEIDLAALAISSSDFQERFYASEVGQPYNTDEQRLLIEYRLVDLDSTPNPVWSAILNSTGEELFHLDAQTGEPVPAPFAAFAQP